MRGLQSNSSKLVKSVSKHKLLLFIFIAACAIALALPATLSFASETTSNSDSATNEGTYTIKGTLNDASGNPFSGGGVMMLGVYPDLERG